MFDDAIDAAPARSSTEAVAQVCEIFCTAGSDNFDVAVFGVADPTAKIEFAGFAVNEPTEAYALHATLNEEVENHSQIWPVFQKQALRCNTDKSPVSKAQIG